MISPFEYGQINDSNEVQCLGQILGQCFNIPESKWELYYNNIGLDNFRILRNGQDIVGGLAIYSMGQWFAGKLIPISGIAAVGIAPEYRGTGAAYTLMSETVQELYHQNMPLSTLYPATQRLYRHVGYEQAGTYCQWEVSLVNLCFNSRCLPMEKIDNPLPELFFEIYQQYASKNNGYLARNLVIWRTILDASDGKIYAYWVGEADNRQGYLIYQQIVIGGEICLKIKDWVALTSAAMERLWTFLSDHRSLVKKCQWTGGMIEPKLLFLPEQTARIINSSLWFMRIINVVQALETRFYPVELDAELELAIADELIPANSGNFKLQVSAGIGKVIPGGTGQLQLNVPALAPLYTGLFTAQQLQTLGKLEATDKALKLATQLFCLPTPALADFF